MDSTIALTGREAVAVVGGLAGGGIVVVAVVVGVADRAEIAVTGDHEAVAAEKAAMVDRTFD